jgi:hypothetical protein
MATHLENAIQELVKEEKALEDRLTVVRRTLDGLRQLVSSGELSSPVQDSHLPATLRSGDATTAHLQAALACFDNSPTGKVYPGDIRDTLKALRDAGKLDSRQTDLLQLAHLTLRGLLRKGLIEKQRGGSRMSPKWYRRVQTHT